MLSGFAIQDGSGMAVTVRRAQLDNVEGVGGAGIHLEPSAWKFGKYEKHRGPFYFDCNGDGGVRPSCSPGRESLRDMKRQVTPDSAGSQ